MVKRLGNFKMPFMFSPQTVNCCLTPKLILLPKRIQFSLQLFIQFIQFNRLFIVTCLLCIKVSLLYIIIGMKIVISFLLYIKVGMKRIISFLLCIKVRMKRIISFLLCIKVRMKRIISFLLCTKVRLKRFFDCIIQFFSQYFTTILFNNNQYNCI